MEVGSLEEVPFDNSSSTGGIGAEDPDSGKQLEHSVMTTSEVNRDTLVSAKNDDEFSTLPEIEKTRSATVHKNKAAKVEDDGMASGELRIHRSASVSGKPTRYDRNGNPITTVIGAFSVETRRAAV